MVSEVVLYFAATSQDGFGFGYELGAHVVDLILNRKIIALQYVPSEIQVADFFYQDSNSRAISLLSLQT